MCFDESLAKFNMRNVCLLVENFPEEPRTIPHLNTARKLPFLLPKYWELLWLLPKTQRTRNSNTSSTTNSTNRYRLPNVCPALCKVQRLIGEQYTWAPCGTVLGLRRCAPRRLWPQHPDPTPGLRKTDLAGPQHRHTCLTRKA